MAQNPSFIHRPTLYSRRPTRVVWVGQVGVGGNYPVRVQSMTTSDTKDTASIIPEIKALVDAGCEIVRVTVPTQADCDNLPNIRAEMKKRGIKVPLVADIHFTPSIAMKAVEFVEKVRINPGNFVDKKLFKVWEYTDSQYAEELERLREKFVPLVLKCKEYGIAMRVGTNHGSLSDRIMNRYGDTPEGMVASALEFLQIAEENHYRDIVLSMKASNVQVMITAYRLLAKRLAETGRDYPFHLGVTEAGEGEDGRVKSAIGIGSLLEDGIGDTIRVSLTEDSIHEIPVAWNIVQNYNQAHLSKLDGTPLEAKPAPVPQSISLNYARRESRPMEIGQPLGGSQPVRVWLNPGEAGLTEFKSAYAAYLKSPSAKDHPLEGVELEARHLQGADLAGLPPLAFKTADPREIDASMPFAKVVAVLCNAAADALSPWKPVLERLKAKGGAMEWCLAGTDVAQEKVNAFVEGTARLCNEAGFENTLYSAESKFPVYAYRRLREALERAGLKSPLHLRANAGGLVDTSVQLGCMLMDGLGDSLQLQGPGVAEPLKLAYNILQGCRLRISKAEYISCPSCGRTQFNLQSTTDRIRQETVHLKGVKIAVMGCIVNGPGEMADADFGYVGTGPKKVSLYVGKECVERNIPEEEAVGRLIALIKAHNRWVDAPEAAKAS